MRLKFIIIAAITLIAIACCVSSCVESAQAQSSSSSYYSIKRVHWDVMYGLKIYKVTTPTGTSYVLRDDDQGGLCTLK